MRVTIAKLRSEPPFVIENADWLAEAFFAMDASGKPGGFDDKARDSALTRIGDEDVDAINATMRARSPQKAWTALKGRELPWLAALSSGWDLAKLDDDAWKDEAASALEAAFFALLQKGRGVSVSTKMLHLKRPRLVPVLDSLVVAQLGSPMPTTPAKAVVLIDHVRRVVNDNSAVLQQIIGYLGLHGVDRSPVRVLDALLWGSHQDSWIAPLMPLLARWREERGGRVS
jgi:Family of unknown function (DUF6308)